jgi:4-hydroxy-tetrahydrodipicolinate synthase
MHGIGPPLVTPFDEDGDVDHDRLRECVAWVENRGVDFLVPCGSTSEAELMTADERRRVIETVVDAASVPVVAGTGHPGLRATLQATRDAHAAGADAALVVTPFYYEHDQQTLAAYYREVAEASPLPVYLYSVPVFTDVRLDPGTVADLATEPNIVGIKDSSGDLGALIQTHSRTADEAFELLTGDASVLAQALDAGATGGILALANLVPERTAEVFAVHEEAPARAREINAALVELNAAVTSEHGIPGLKWAMRERGAPAGYPRAPHGAIDAPARDQIRTLLADAH